MRSLWALAAVAALAAISVWGPTWLITIAWLIAAMTLMGAAMNRSPSVQLRGRVNRIDSGAGPPVDERHVKRP
jgi:hypothetical protein